MVMADRNMVDIRNGRRSRCATPNDFSDDSSAADDSDHGKLSPFDLNNDALTYLYGMYIM